MTADDLDAVVGRAAEGAAFSGAVRVDRPGWPPFEAAFGWADRRWRVPFTTGTRASVASATKGFTALVVMALVEAGTWSLGTTARSLLGGDLPLVDDAVTLEDLLAHRSGIGDYLDESDTADINDHVMPVPVHQLSSTEAYLPLLDGHPQVFTPGDRFAYNNGGFVLLALLAERATGRPFDRLVADLVCAPAGLTQTGFVRSDALPRAVATGYLDPDGWRTNALHLPVMGSGDGGLVTTVGDVRRFWRAVVAGRIVNPATLARMAEPRSDVPAEGKRYGLGLWLHPTGPQLALEGYDAGVSFRTWHHPLTGETLTVIGNTSNGAWPVVAALEAEIVPA